jgi:hypothetical protein
MEGSYKISAKRNDKWWTYGNLKKNQWGNYTIGMKVTPELMALLEGKQGQYVNFSLFEDEGKKPATPQAPDAFDDSQTIPF